MRRALVDALALDVSPDALRGDQALFGPPVRMDSLGFTASSWRSRYTGTLDEQALEPSSRPSMI